MPVKRIVVFFIAIILGKAAFAQGEAYQKAVEEFETNYNADAFDKIFAAFSPEMQKALPLGKTNEFLSGLKKQVGKIIRKEFVTLQPGTYASYKTTFESAVLSLNISLDDKNQINGLFLKPFEEKRNGGENTVNALGNMPQELVQLVFNRTNAFPDKTQLSIAVIENGTVKYYGIIKENDTLKAIDNKDSVFEIGSVTKVFTATLLADAVLEQKIKLDGNINTFYDFPFKDDIAVSFVDLANHTSGLPRLPSNLDLTKVEANNPYKNYDSKLLYIYLKDSLQLQQSGEKYAYSNLGAGLLGHTLGIVEKARLTDLLENKIFRKYKMLNSYTTSKAIGYQLVKGLDGQGNEVPNWDFDVLFGGGGILSTASDLSKFLIAHFDPANKELELTREPTFTVNNNMKLGLGWHIIKTEWEKEIYWHNGGTGGYSSSMAMDTKNRTGIIILSNVSAFNPDMANIDKLCFDLMKSID